MLTDYEVVVVTQALERERYQRQRLGKALKTRRSNLGPIARRVRQARSWVSARWTAWKQALRKASRLAPAGGC